MNEWVTKCTRMGELILFQLRKCSTLLSFSVPAVTYRESKLILVFISSFMMFTWTCKNDTPTLSIRNLNQTYSGVSITEEQNRPVSSMSDTRVMLLW